MFFFQAIQAGKMSFTIFQNEKAHFYGIKTRSSKIRKINIFPKGLGRGFGPKMAIFLSFFCQEIQARKMSFTIFQNEKTVFYALKTRISKVEKLTFSQRVTHGFSPKIAIFLTFFFRPNRPGKCLLRHSRSKKSPSWLQKQEFQKIDIFSERLTHGFGRKMAIFPSFFFQPTQARKMTFTIFQNAKTPFQAIKTRTSKSRKIDILVQKWSFFQFFF